MANAPSRIASLLIAASGVWETTQGELAVVNPGESSPDHSLAYWEAIVECSEGASESNSCLLLFEILSYHNCAWCISVGMRIVEFLLMPTTSVRESIYICGSPE